MEPEHFVGRVAQKALIVDGNKVLVSRDVNQSQWDIPGGRLHLGETPVEGLEREIKEELGVAIKVKCPLYSDTFFNGDEPHFLIVYLTELTSSADFKLAPNEIEEVRWIDSGELRALPMWAQYKQALERYFVDLNK